MSKISAYFSHSIRGKKGVAATLEDMDANCAKAKKVANCIRIMIPELELYVPAEHEDFVQIAWFEKILTEKQILDIDCKIVAKRDLLIVLEVDGWRGGGIAVEIEEAKKNHIPIFYFTAIDEVNFGLLEHMVREVIEMKEGKQDG